MSRSTESAPASGGSPRGAEANDAPVLISACLLGERCRYDGVVRRHLQLATAPGRAWVPVCPERLGGLPTPRPAAEIVGGDGEDVIEGRAQVIDERGRDVSAEFLRGARAARDAAVEAGVRRAILKSRSPSCGVGELACRRHIGAAAPQGLASSPGLEDDQTGDPAGDTVRATLPGNGVLAALLLRAGIEVEAVDFTPEETPAAERPDTSDGREEPPCPPSS